MYRIASFMLLFLSFLPSAVKIREPILLLATNGGYGTYMGEILKTEGINEYRMDSVEDANFREAFINQFDIVVLAEPVNDPAQAVRSALIQSHSRDYLVVPVGHSKFSLSMLAYTCQAFPSSGQLLRA